MHIEILRYAHGTDSTLGLLLVDGAFTCYTCEDERRHTKVPGQTRIPEGRYNLVLRHAGAMNERYGRRFAEIGHAGMLWLLDVPGFEWVYIHVGNTEADTDGCILVGEDAVRGKDGGGTLLRSVGAYMHLYQQVLRVTERKEPVTVSVRSL